MFFLAQFLDISSRYKTPAAVGIVMVAVVLAPIGAQASNLSMARQLSDLGSPQAALGIIDSLQKVRNIRTQDWEYLERERVNVLHRWEMWPRIVKRGLNMPAKLNATFYEWMLQHTIGAMLELNENARARALLRDWVWGPEDTRRNLRLWQREIINSYLSEGSIRDAAIALEYYLREYGDSLIGIELEQQALLLLLTSQYDKALGVLKQAGAAPNSFLHLLASLRSNKSKPATVLRVAQQQAQGRQLNHSQRLRFLKVAFEAASISAPDAYQDLFLQLLASPVFGEPDQLFNIDAGAQWAYWIGRAREIGNEYQLLIGKDATWLALAAKLEKAGSAHPARALYAFVAVHGLGRDYRDRAHQRLADNLEKLPGGGRVLVNLYINAPLVIKYHNLGEKTRFKIADKAFLLNLPEEASRLLADLPVRKEYALLKVLQQARILLLGGLHARGAQVLRKVLKQDRKLSREELDRLLQVVFDLQNLNLHIEALEIFEIILANGPSEKVRRETLFWMANSLSYQKRYSEAAWHYLQSAHLLGSPGDLWGKTSRYYAAEVLIKGEFLTDAVRLFEKLLNEETEGSRRSVLLNRIQQLHLQMSQNISAPVDESKR